MQLLITLESIKDKELKSPIKRKKIGVEGDYISFAGTEVVKDYTKSNKRFWIAMISMSIIGILLLAFTFYIRSITPKGEQTVETPITISNKGQKLTESDKLKNSLEEESRGTNIPYKISTEELLSGYILGSTTYYPDDAKKLYIDFKIQKPENKKEQATDATATKILESFKKTLPKINDTIEVKDQSKLTMEIYKKGDNYQTILLYENEPFAYVDTNKDLISTNTVTSDYITKVAKQ